jgi:hypothetical protein
LAPSLGFFNALGDLEVLSFARQNPATLRFNPKFDEAGGRSKNTGFVKNLVIHPLLGHVELNALVTAAIVDDNDNLFILVGSRKRQHLALIIRN